MEYLQGYMQTLNFPIDDSLIPIIIPSAKIRLTYRAMGKVTNVKKLVQLLLVDTYLEYKNVGM